MDARLLTAVREGDVVGVYTLLEQGANPSAGLHPAALTGNTLIIRGLLRAGADINAMHASEGGTPLLFAAVKGKAQAVRLLLEKGADPNARGDDGRTPLHWAARAGSVESVEYLLRAGADPRATDSIRCTPRRWVEGVECWGIRARIPGVADGGRCVRMWALRDCEPYPQILATLARAECARSVSP
jgi:hypothetical protein